MNVLHGHTTPETAHLSYEYPFGHNRCVRREWLEYKPKQGYRLVTQTTVRPFNYEYTERLDVDGSQAANEWAKQRLDLAATSKHWNARKASTYSPVLAIMTEEPLADGSGRLGVSWRGIGFSLESAEKLRDETAGQLDDQEASILDEYLTYHRAYDQATREAESRGLQYPETVKLGMLAGRKALVEKQAAQHVKDCEPCARDFAGEVAE